MTSPAPPVAAFMNSTRSFPAETAPGAPAISTQRIGEAFTSVCAPKCPTVEVFRNSTAPNALTFASPGQMKIVYSPPFFTTVMVNAVCSGMSPASRTRNVTGFPADAALSPIITSIRPS